MFSIDDYDYDLPRRLVAQEKGRPGPPFFCCGWIAAPAGYPITVFRPCLISWRRGM